METCPVITVVAQAIGQFQIKDDSLISKGIKIKNKND